MPEFKEILERNSWNKSYDGIYSKTSVDVENALGKEHLTLEDFKALVSPAAEPYLEQMAYKSQQLTKARFGNTIQMYIPMYLSNECNNICTYCGFSLNNKIERKTLTDDEILTEVEAVNKMGFDHVLLVTGEDERNVGIDYFLNAVQLIQPYFSNISIEVQPLKQGEYEQLFNCGVNTVLVYQETYHEQEYKKHHPKGRKSNFDYRLDTPERLGRAGVQKMGLGVLLGLEDWRTDSFYCALHLDYLERKYWKSKYAISFPRLRPCAGGVDLKSNMTDAQLLQLICAYRLFNPEVELSLSTRESEMFRNNLIGLGITTISAGSKTEPGGYAVNTNALKQFDISDERSPEEMVAVIKSKGYDPVWKDWDKVLQ